LNVDGNEEGTQNQFARITVEKSSQFIHENNSLIMGSFENFDLHHDKEQGQPCNAEPSNDLNNNSSTIKSRNQFFNIDIDDEIAQVNMSKTKNKMEETSVEPSEFEHHVLINHNQGYRSKGEHSAKQNNMNMSELSRLSSNNQCKNKRLNTNAESFNGSSQKKPSKSHKGAVTALADDQPQNQAKFKINFEPFNENKSIDQNMQKRGGSNLRKDFQKNANFTHRGNVLVTDYSFDSFDGFNARDKLEIDNLYRQKNNSIYQPSFFGKFNNETCSQGNISHDFRQSKNYSDKMRKNAMMINSSEAVKTKNSHDSHDATNAQNKIVESGQAMFYNPSLNFLASSIKNKSDGGHGGSGDSFTLSNHNKDNNLFTSFHMQDRNDKLYKICKIDGSISESKQRDRCVGIQFNQPGPSKQRGSFNDHNKPRVSVNDPRNSAILDNVESPILIKASRSVFNENTKQKYFDISNDDLSGIGKSQMKRGKEMLIDDTPLDSKQFINIDFDYERDS